MFSAKDIVIGPNLQSEFVGYTESSCDAACLELFDEHGNNVEKLISQGFALFSQTPFYAEMGGQVGDTGSIIKKGSEITVTDCKKVGNFHLHEVLITSGELCKGDVAKLMIDLNRREKIDCNHSATHLLHSALREVLGDKVFQKSFSRHINPLIENYMDNNKDKFLLLHLHLGSVDITFKANNQDTKIRMLSLIHI